MLLVGHNHLSLIIIISTTTLSLCASCPTIHGRLW
jgi:hypothetical protein